MYFLISLYLRKCFLFFRYVHQGVAENFHVYKVFCYFFSVQWFSKSSYLSNAKFRHVLDIKLHAFRNSHDWSVKMKIYIYISSKCLRALNFKYDKSKWQISIIAGYYLLLKIQTFFIVWHLLFLIIKFYVTYIHSKIWCIKK